MKRMHCVYYAALVAVVLSVNLAPAETYYVSPKGSDSNVGSKKKPFLTLCRARDAAREQKGGASIILREGTYYLEKPLVLTERDSGSNKTPTVFASFKNERVIISGGLKLDLTWKPYRNGIMQAATPAGLAIDQLFIDGQRQHMARYPNYDPASTKPYNGCAADAFSPERAAKWSDPSGGFIHALHSRHWGGFHYLITGKNEKNEVIYEGGWQNNRKMGLHRHDRFVENIFEELDAPGEWFHNAKTQTLYFYPTEGLNIKAATFEAARLNHLIEIQGSRDAPVKHIALKGLIFQHANRTFMETKEPLLRSDWTIYRGGAILINGAEDCMVEDCEFDQIGGNGVFVNNYNRRIAVRGSHFHGIGASAVLFVGDPGAVRSPRFEYNETYSYAEIDKTPGPKTDNYPADCVVEDCLIHTISVIEKQATGVQVSMSKGITIRHCSIYDTGRAGINISEGTFGGHLIEFCDVFDTVRETGDHGSFNSWGRDRFWHLKDAPEEELPKLALLDTEKTIIRNSRWRCDRGWDIDLDDGSTNYELYNNLMLNGGLKFREGFHRKAYNNIGINCGFHPHVWYQNSGDKVYNNIWMKATRAIGMRRCKKWGDEIDRNMFVRESDRAKDLGSHVEVNSIVGDPMFVNPAKGDFRVKRGSPALKMGFKNFPMDEFGVMKPELRAKAATPKLPVPVIPDDIKGVSVVVVEQTVKWLGASARALAGEEYSAFGVSKDDMGIQLVDVPAGSKAEQVGLKADDIVQAINGISTKTTAELLNVTQFAKELEISYVRAQNKHVLTTKK